MKSKSEMNEFKCRCHKVLLDNGFYSVTEKTVIEHSALTKLQEQCDKLVSALENIENSITCDRADLLRDDAFRALKQYEEFKNEI